jgi:hypothetical protein
MSRIWIFTFCVILAIYARSQIGYEYIIGSDECNEVFEDITISDNGVVFGILNTFCPNDTSIIVTQSKVYRFSPTGDSLVFEYQKADTILQFHNICITHDGNIILAGDGYTTQNKLHGSETSNFEKVSHSLGVQNYTEFQWFCKVTTDFSVIWEQGYKNVGDSLYTTNSLIKQLNDDRYIYIANVKNKTNQWPYLYLFEFNNVGDSMFYKVFEEELTSKVYSITTSSDFSNVHLHKNYWEFGSPYHCCFLNLDTNYNGLSNFVYPIQSFHEPFYTVINNSGEYLSFGYYYYMGESFLDIIMFDTIEGLIAQNKLTPGDMEVSSPWNRGIDYYYPNQIYVAGIYNYQIYPQEPNWIYVACLNNQLDIINEEYIGGDDYYDTWSIQATPDGGVVIAGRIDNLQTTEEIYDAYLLKLDSSMFVCINDQINIKQDSKIVVYPNPAVNTINIQNPIGNKQINIYSIHGALKLSYDITMGINTVNISNLIPGFYTWVVPDDYSTYKGVFIKK